MSDSPSEAASGLTDFGYQRVSPVEKGARVRAVFESVASRYDLMNDLMSLGVHRLWKRELVAALEPRSQDVLLDLAAGSGDVGYGWLEAGGGPAILSDVNASMLAVAQDRPRRAKGRVCFLQADAEALPLAERSVDRVSIAFGLRNCTNKDRVLGEARRVLKPGGRFLCLEFSRVRVAALAPIYDAWSFGALPRLGRAVVGDAESYRYLAESVRTFADQETLAGMMRHAGLARVRWRDLSGGIAAIHAAWRL